DEWLRTPVSDPRPYFLRGLANEQIGTGLGRSRGYYDKVIKDYEQAVQLDPEYDEARDHLAQLHVYQGNHAAARPHFEVLIRRRPGDPAPLVGLAGCYTAAGISDKARQ